MKPRELFTVGVKGLGLYYIVQGVFSLLRILDVVVPLILSQQEQLQSHHRIEIGTFISASVLYFAISALFMRRGDWLVDFAFPDETGRQNSKIGGDIGP